MATHRNWPALLLLLVFVVLYLGYRLYTLPPSIDESAVVASGGERTIVEAFEQRRSDLWVEAEGTVERLLADDVEGSRHQRFIVRLADGHTVLVSHNIDLAPRVPLARRDRLAFRGEYEWNDRGGVVHWTHRDPQGRRQGGWILHDGRRYD